MKGKGIFDWLTAVAGTAQLPAGLAESYQSCVTQARSPHFYAAWSVPDSLDGRFDMLVLHLHLLLRQLRDGPEAAAEGGQALFDHFFREMDQSLREIGVSDLSVGKRIKDMAQAFYGRVKAYDEALEGPPEALAEVLARNVYAGAGPAEGAKALAAYVVAQDANLAEQGAARILAGKIGFLAPEALEAGHAVL